MNWLSSLAAGEQETARLQQRLVGFALLGVLLTGIAVGLATAIPSYRSARASVETSAQYQVRLQAIALGQYLRGLRDVAMQVTSRTIIRDQLVQYNLGRVRLRELQAFSTDKLADAMRQHPDAAGITRLDARGRPVVQVGVLPPELAPVPPRDSQEPLLAAPVAVGANTYLVVGAPIITQTGERVGTDLVVFRSHGLAGILHGLEKHQQGSEAFLATDTAAALWTADAEHQLIAVTQRPLTAAAVSQGLNGAFGLHRGDEPLVALYAPLMHGWAVVVTTPTSVLYAPAWQEITPPVLAVLFMLLVASFGTTRLLRPLARRSVNLAGQLRTTAEEQHSLLEYARSFLYRTDGGGRIESVSPSVEDVLGFAPSQLPPATLQLLEEAACDGVPGQELPPRLVHVKDRHARDVVLEIHARGFRTTRGERRVLGVARDVTARVHAEQALREGEERLRTLINAGPDFICFKDGAGRWQEVNDAGLALFDLRAAAYRGRTDEELAAAASPACAGMLRAMAEGDERAWRAGAALRSEEAIPGARGEHILDLIRVPLFDAAGQRSGLVVLGRDVTERRQAERELARTTVEWTYAMDFLDDAICLIDLDDRVVRANRAFHVLTHRTPEQVIGRSIVEIIHPQGESKTCRVCRARTERRDAFINLDARDPDNPFGRAIEMMIKIIPDADGSPARILLGIHDLTRLRRTEEELHLAATVFQGTHEGIVITDGERRVLRVNEAFARITGFSAGEIAGRSLDDVLHARNGEDIRHTHIWEAVAQHGQWQGEAWYRRHSGELFPAWHRISALRDQHGEILHYINLFTDITDKKLSEERIHHLAHYDVLTDLPNRLLFNDRFLNSTERAQRKGTKLALLFLDLDRFKMVNDTLGHHIGDSLLQVIADRLRLCVREQDTVARLGGDEFTVVLEDLRDVQDAGVVATKILQAIAQPVVVEQQELFVGASIGISVFPDDGRDVQLLLRNADAAMYRAKEQGRNTYQFYTPELTRVSIERLDLENNLRRALERGELRLHYQPQVAINNGKVIGAEALLRWAHPAKGMIPPNVFVPLAEDSGLMGQIGSWVIETACTQLRDWQAAGLGIRRMAVNLSGQQIIRGNLIATVREILDRTGIDPSDLELEVTEGFVMSHLNDGVEVLHGLKYLGVTLAIDDFGTGYSSLAYLKRLPIDRLKIDRSFVQDIPADRDDMAIAATIIAMAHNLDLQVIAEGVEQQAQMDFLRRHECDEVQGFLFGKPVPADQFAALLPRLRRAGEA